MPYGLKRFQKAEALHFITFSCFHRLPFLEAPATKETFEFVLEQTRSRHGARVYAYVLMPEHIHLLINEPPLILVAQFHPWRNSPVRSDPIYPPEPRQKGTGRIARAVPMEQLQPLRYRNSRSR